MSGTHSLFAPSSDERHIDCPASLLVNARLPEETSIWAETGTLAHEIADKSWRQNVAPETFLGVQREVRINGRAETLTVDKEMVQHVATYLDWCREVEGDHYPEHRVEVTNWCPPSHMLAMHPQLPQEPRQFGTCDHAVCVPGKLTIIDFKYGEGVQVFAEENAQLIKYALGMFDAYDMFYGFREVEIRICQPRLSHFDVWKLHASTLIERGSEIKRRLMETLRPNPRFGPSERACRFCKARKTCSALAAKLHGERALAFDDLTGELTPMDELTTADLVSAWKLRPLFNIRYTAIEDALDRLLLSGEKVPGLKLVDGRSFRKWRSERDAIATMEYAGLRASERWEETLISPAQAEKLLPKAKRALLEPAIIKPPGAPTLVDENDPRPEHGSRHVEAMDDLETEA